MMATAPYNRQPQSLADVFAMAMNGTSGPSAPPVAPQAPSIDTQGTLTPQQRSALLEQIFNPQPTTVAAPPEEKPTWGKKLAGSFADAFSNIATIYAGGPDLRSNYLQSYLASIERKNAERKSKAERQAEQEARLKGDKAKYILGEDAAIKERQLAETAAKAKALEEERLRKEKRGQELEDARIKREQAVSDEIAKHVYEGGKAALQHKYDIELENLRNSHKDPDEKKVKQGEKDQAAFAKGTQIALVLRDGDPKQNIPSIAEQLKQGAEPKVLAAALRKRFNEELDAEGVFGHGRDLALNSFNLKMIEAFENAASQP